MVEGHILISVQPRYAADIVAGRKTVELRRRPLRLSAGSKVWIYSKSPAAEITALATVKHVVSASPQLIWSKHRMSVGLSVEEFNSYFAGCSVGYAIVFSQVQPLQRAVSLKQLRSRVQQFHPPQFFKRLSAGSPELRLLLSAIKD